MIKIRPGVPTIGRDAALTVKIMGMVAERERKKLRRQAFWQGVLSVLSIDCWKKRIKNKRFILTINEIHE